MQICSSVRPHLAVRQSCAYLEDVLLSLLKPGWHKYTSPEQGMFSATRRPSRAGSGPELPVGRGVSRMSLLTGRSPNLSQAWSVPLSKLQPRTWNDSIDNIVFCCKHIPRTLIQPFTLSLPLFADTASSYRLKSSSELAEQNGNWQGVLLSHRCGKAAPSLQHRVCLQFPLFLRYMNYKS